MGHKRKDTISLTSSILPWYGPGIKWEMPFFTYVEMSYIVEKTGVEEVKNNP